MTSDSRAWFHRRPEGGPILALWLGWVLGLLGLSSALGALGCAPLVRVEPPAPATGAEVAEKAVGIGSFSGADGPAFARLLQARLEKNSGVRIVRPGRAALVLGGEVVFEAREMDGEDLIKENLPTGYSRPTEVLDPFVGRKFKYRKPVTVEGVRPVPFHHRSAEVRLTFSLTDPQGRIIHGPESLNVQSDRKYGGLEQAFHHGPGVKDLPPLSRTRDQLLHQAADELAQRLAPEPEVYYLVLDRGTGPAGETIIIRGTQRAAEGRWDEAEALWREVLAQNPDHPAALFNLGVTLERRGGRDNLEQAQKNYARANLISNQPRYREALTRVMLRLAAPTGSPLP